MKIAEIFETMSEKKTVWSKRGDKIIRHEKSTNDFSKILPKTKVNKNV